MAWCQPLLGCSMARCFPCSRAGRLYWEDSSALCCGLDCSTQYWVYSIHCSQPTLIGSGSLPRKWPLELWQASWSCARRAFLPARMCLYLLYGQESKLPDLFHREKAERSADEPDPVSVCIRRSPPCTPLGLQHSKRSTSEGFGASGTESGCGLRHSLRTELRRLPWRGRAWRSVDCPCQSGL